MDLLINGILAMRLDDPTAYRGLDARYEGCHIDIGIDQSKSHTAIMVGPAGSGYSDYIEILGDGGDVDVFNLCAFTRYAMMDLFRGAKIRLVGIEDPITKKGYVGPDGQYHENKGMSTHENRLKLTAVFCNFMFIFQDLSGKQPMRVNNNDWKGLILPAEYRTRKHDKGSFDWHRDRGTFLGNTNDNVTDAACILDYIRAIRSGDDILQQIKSDEVPKGEYVYILRDYKTGVRGNTFQYNPELSFKANLCYVRNRLVDNVGIIVAPVDSIPIDEFYKETCELHYGEASSLFIFVGGA